MKNKSRSPGTSANGLYLAISHPVRRAVLDELKGRGVPSTQLAARFGMSPSALSQHLRVLKNAGLVSEQRAGRQRIYELTAKPLREVSDWVDAFSRLWTGKLEALGANLKRSRK